MKKQNLLSAFDHILGPKVETPPDDFLTAQQLAKRRGVSRSHMNQKLNELLDAKKISRIKGRNDEGRVCWFYGVR